MKILIVWMVLHVLRIAESSVSHRRWSELQEQQQPKWLPSQNRAATEMTELLNHRWIWNRNSNSEGLPRFGNELLPEQRKRTTADIAAISTEGLGPTWIRLSGKSVCSCESEEQVRNLGSGHYPRFLTTSRCKPETCQSKFYPCTLIKYTVYVLRLRDTSNVGISTMLPESLNNKWLMKPITVAVACVPAFDTRRN